MGIIFRFVSKNILDKKFRTFLIVFTVFISSALFFASNSISDTFLQMVTARFKVMAGTADISVSPNRESPTSYLYTRGAETLKNKFVYVVGVLNGSAFYKIDKDNIVNFSITGINLEDLQLWNPITFYEQHNPLPFEGRKIIISKYTADKYGFKVGDSIKLELNSTQQRFVICALANAGSIFSDESRASYAVIPRATLATLTDKNGKVNTVYIKVKQQSQITQLIAELAPIYSKYEVQEPMPREQIASALNQIKIPFQMMMLIVTFMSVFIIYSTFKVITAERLPIIGTLRSIGATKRITNLILLVESGFYGLLGGVLGHFAGMGVLYLMTVALTPKGMGGGRGMGAMEATSISIPIQPLQLLSTVLFALVLCFVSSIFPILKVSRISVKDIVLNAIEYSNPKKLSKLITGLVLLFLGILIPYFAPKSLAVILGVICILAGTAGVVVLVPYITNGFIKIFEFTYAYLFGNEGILAAKNLRENKSVLTSISLLTIGISSLLMINTISSTLSNTLLNLTTNSTKYDMEMSIRKTERNSDDSLLRLLARVEGIKGVYGTMDASRIKYPAKNDQIGTIEGIDTNTYTDFWKIDFEGDGASQMQELDAGRNILVTTTLRDKFDLKEGDLMELTFPRGNKVYKVVGFFNTLKDQGDDALISRKFFKSDTGEKYYNEFLIRTSEAPSIVEKRLNSEFIRLHPRIMTLESMRKMGMQSLGQLFLVLTSFSGLAMLIGIIGVFNNMLIGFISRRHSLAMFRSLGMSSRQMLKMFLIESLTSGLIGGVLGIFAAILMLSKVSIMTKALGFPMEMLYSSSAMLISVLAGVVITVAATIGPALKTAKMNIIEAIKFE